MRSQFFRQIAQKFRIPLCWCDFPVKPKKHALSTDRVQILGAVNQIRTGDLFLTKEVLYQLSYIGDESERRGSNPRPSAWKADALSTELLSQFAFEMKFWHLKICGQWRIRTSEVERQLSYSQPQLATLVTTRFPFKCSAKIGISNETTK